MESSVQRLSEDLFHIDLYCEVFELVVIGELTHLVLHLNNLTFLYNIQSIFIHFEYVSSGGKAVYKSKDLFHIDLYREVFGHVDLVN